MVPDMTQTAIRLENCLCGHNHHHDVFVIQQRNIQSILVVSGRVAIITIQASFYVSDEVV